MGLFKSKQEKQIEERILVKRAISNIKGYIARLDSARKAYIDEAKKAKLLGVSSQYSLAKSAIKLVNTQRLVAEQLLLTMEMSEQLKDSAQITEVFSKGMDSLSREISSVNNRLNFTKVSKKMNRAFTDSADIAANTDITLQESSQLFEAVSADNGNEDEIDQLIAREMAVDGDGINMDMEIDSLLRKGRKNG